MTTHNVDDEVILKEEHRYGGDTFTVKRLMPGNRYLVSNDDKPNGFLITESDIQEEE